MTECNHEFPSSDYRIANRGGKKAFRCSKCKKWFVFVLKPMKFELSKKGKRK